MLIVRVRQPVKTSSKRVGGLLQVIDTPPGTLKPLMDTRLLNTRKEEFPTTETKRMCLF